MNPTACAAGTSPSRGGTVVAIKAPLKGAADKRYTEAILRREAFRLSKNSGELERRLFQKGGLRLSKNPRRAREGRSPFELSIVPSGVYGGHGAIFAPENPIFQRKNRFLAVSAPEKSLIFSGDW